MRGLESNVPGAAPGSVFTNFITRVVRPSADCRRQPIRGGDPMYDVIVDSASQGLRQPAEADREKCDRRRLRKETWVSEC